MAAALTPRDQAAIRSQSASPVIALAPWLIATLLAGCALTPSSRPDGPGTRVPSELTQVPDAQPRVEPIRTTGSTSKPYTVLGRSYAPIMDDRSFHESGLASWYGSKFHGQRTASGEAYDMYAMTAAHKTLPLPSYVRVRNPANDREIIVRVNDRGPFHDGRIIDLSYAAASRLDLLRGVAPVEIDRITNEDIRTGAWRRDGGTAVTAAALTPAVRTTAERETVSSAKLVPVIAAAAEIKPSEGDVLPSPREAMVVRDLAPISTVSPSAATPSTPASNGFWVQLGAFREAASAESLRARTLRDVSALSVPLRIFAEGGTHRLQAGPFESRSAANEALSALREGLNLTPIVVERR